MVFVYVVRVIHCPKYDSKVFLKALPSSARRRVLADVLYIKKIISGFDAPVLRNKFLNIGTRTLNPKFIRIKCSKPDFGLNFINFTNKIDFDPLYLL